MQDPKVTFSSDVNLQNFTDYLDLRYPSNLMEVDKNERSVTFKGGMPSYQVLQNAQDHNGIWDT